MGPPQARRYDERDVRIRPGRGSRPRTKQRPEHADAETALVTAVDRGRYAILVDPDGPDERVAIAMKARELGRDRVVPGDRVDIVGDTSGDEGSLSRIVRINERRTVLRRTADDTDPVERIIVANADQLVIVTALADPEPRTRMIDRCVAAAYDARMDALLALTKADLADPAELVGMYAPIGVEVVVTSAEKSVGGRIIHGLDDVRAALEGKTSVLVGHSGVGKSTLVNALVPDADRAVGVVSGVGKGRHTSTSAVALALPAAGDEAERSSTREAVKGWVVDTPGIRSFGLAHIDPDDVVKAFGDLAEAVQECPRGCGHLGPPADPECALDPMVEQGRLGAGRLDALRRVLTALRIPAWEI